METDNTTQIRADENRYRDITARIPAGRWGTPEDLKGPVVFLASAASGLFEWSRTECRRRLDGPLIRHLRSVLQKEAMR